jgi:hypothetical protein
MPHIAAEERQKTHTEPGDVNLWLTSELIEEDSRLKDSRS